MNKKKCPYCGKSILFNEDFCGNKCKILTRKFLKFSSKWYVISGILITISIIAIFIGSLITVLNSKLGWFIVSMGFNLLGIITIIFPFGSTELFKKLGLKKTLIIIRILGIIILVSSSTWGFYKIIS